MTDEELRVKGTGVVVKNVEDLAIYDRKLNPALSAPCENWFEDNDPPVEVPIGYIAIRQLYTGCLAFLAIDQSEEMDQSETEREAKDLTKKSRWWPWDAADLVAVIVSFFKSPW